MREKWLWIAALLLAALLSGCAGEAAEPPAVEAPEARMLTVATPEPEEEPDKLRLTAQTGHPALMACGADGAFSPETPVKRRELGALLSAMLGTLPPGAADFSDISPRSADYETASALTTAGIFPEEGGVFRPNDAVTRSELSSVLRRLGVRLTAAAAGRASALAEDVATGRTAPDGTAADGDEDEPILRAELAAVLVRLAGREPDEAGLFLGGHLPPDVALDDYAWAFIADAVTDGPVETPAAGAYRADGWLYATWGDGTLIRDMDWGVWTFRPDGAYTTGDEELDGYLRDALEASGANGLEGQDALEAAYLYVKEIGEYLVRPEDMDVLEMGATGWEYERAARFFRYGGGTCYGYAAAFGLMARALGETAYIVSGEVNQYYGAHAFVVIPEGDTDWVYDVELEDTRPERHGDLSLFRIEGRGYYNYWYDSVWS